MMYAVPQLPQQGQNNSGKLDIANKVILFECSCALLCLPHQAFSWPWSFASVNLVLLSLSFEARGSGGLVILAAFLTATCPKT